MAGVDNRVADRFQGIAEGADDNRVACYLQGFAKVAARLVFVLLSLLSCFEVACIKIVLTEARSRLLGYS